MHRPIGLETEYGLYIEGRGAADQIEDARAFVAGSGIGRSGLWDYRHESPRADLRGFDVKNLTVDPEDAEYDGGKSYGSPEEVRADRILANGARFYNDHGHPEYATPECLTLDELAAADQKGEEVLLQAAQRYGEASGRPTKVYKNNTDFHGASYGTHESYLVPRELGFERLFRAVTPMLIARQILCGAGKVGCEHGQACDYQISQRADFFSEKASVDTLFRRPIFNTRDEPHADHSRWIRLHVIAGDANMMPACTRRKVGLIRLALMLEEIGEAPCWNFADPVRAFETISKDQTYRFEIPLGGGSWTTAYEVIESYLAAFEAKGGRSFSEPRVDNHELVNHVKECRELLNTLSTNPSKAAPHIDWLAKRAMLEQIMNSENLNWRSQELRSYDLEYHNIDHDEGLYFALVEMGEIADGIRPIANPQASRARVRGLAIGYPELVRANWRTLTFDLDGQIKTVELLAENDYAHVQATPDVVSFIRSLETS